MKKLSLFIFILISLAGNLSAQAVWSNKSRLMPDKLRGIPVGILMSHDPNPCYPVMVADTFYWIHNTKATALYQQLTVVACGSFTWYDDSGWHDNMHYSLHDFSEAFACYNGVLKKGKTYTYKRNIRFGTKAYGGDALWYIIAKDKNGKLYKGTALIETEANIQTTNK